jgi:hypothetical protein
MLSLSLPPPRGGGIPAILSGLARRKKYNNKIRDVVLDHLSLNANDTLRWVALVCQDQPSQLSVDHSQIARRRLPTIPTI